jgi:hypothetical protein
MKRSQLRHDRRGFLSGNERTQESPISTWLQIRLAVEHLWKLNLQDIQEFFIL